MTIAVLQKTKTKPKTKAKGKKKPQSARYSPNCNRANKGFWIDKELYAKFRDIFDKEGLSMSNFLERAIATELESRGIKHDPAPLHARN